MVTSPSVYVFDPPRNVRLRSIPRRADPPAAFIAIFGRRLRGTISPDAVNALAQAIQTQEGYYPGTVAYQNNNPGNLVYAGQPGATLGAGGFASFSSYQAGYSALENQITLDATRGTDVNGNPINTVSDLIGSWAPPSENNTPAYIASVAAQTGYDPNASLSTLGAPQFSVTVTSTPLPAGLSSDSTSAQGIDLSALDQPVDLSGIGIGSSAPLWAVGGVALLALLFLARR